MSLSLIQTGLNMTKFNQILLAASAVLFSSFAVADKLADDTHGVHGWGLNIFNTSGENDGGIGIAYSTGDMEFGYNTYYAKEERTDSAGTKEDIDLAVAAAKNAFQSFGFSSKEDRVAILEEIIKNIYHASPVFQDALFRGNFKVIKGLLGPALRGLILQPGKNNNTTKYITS